MSTSTTLYTPAEAAEQLPFHPRTLVAFAREGKIGHVRLGQRKIRFRQQDIDAFIASSAAPTSQPKPARHPKYSK